MSRVKRPARAVTWWSKSCSRRSVFARSFFFAAVSLRCRREPFVHRDSFDCRWAVCLFRSLLIDLPDRPLRTSAATVPSGIRADRAIGLMMPSSIATVIDGPPSTGAGRAREGVL